jgi:hypothetical protein
MAGWPARIDLLTLAAGRREWELGVWAEMAEDVAELAMQCLTRSRLGAS